MMRIGGSYFFVILLSLFLCLFLAYPNPDSEISGGSGDNALQGVLLPALGTWNGFLGHVVVLECMNQKGVISNLSLRVKDYTDEIIGEEEFSIPGFGKKHIMLNRFDLENKYGTFELRKLASNDNPSISCNTLTYRYNALNEIEYVTSSSLNSVLRGKSYGVYNSINPDASASAPVYNWLTIYNPGDVPFSGKVYVKDHGGNEVWVIGVDEIAPGIRQDFGLGHIWGQVVGTYEIVPDNPLMFYGAFLNRYSEVSSGRFNFSIHIPGSAGTKDTGMIGASSMGPAWNWAEIANVSSEEVKVSLEVFNRHGELIHERQIEIMPYSQHHEFMNAHIGESNVGFFRVKSDKKVLVQSFYYGHGSEYSGQIAWAYNSRGGDGFYKSASLGVNTNLNAANWLKVFAADDNALSVTMSVFDESGNEVETTNGGILDVSGSTDIPLHEYVGDNFSGSVYLKVPGEGMFRAELVRVLMTQHGSTRSIPGIETMIAMVPPAYQVNNTGGNGKNVNDPINNNEELDLIREEIKKCTIQFNQSNQSCEKMHREFCESSPNDPICENVTHESINISQYNISPNNKELASSNTIALKRLVSPSQHGGTSSYTGKIKFNQTGIYYFNDIIPLRNGIEFDLAGNTVHFEKEAAPADRGSGFFTSLGDFKIQNGTIVVIYNNPQGILHAGSAIKIGCRNSDGSHYFPAVFEKNLEKPMKNFVVRNIKIISNNSGDRATGISLRGGLSNVLFENVTIDGVNSLRTGIYYEFGFAERQNERPPGHFVSRSTHAHDMWFKDIKIENLDSTLGGIGLGITGGYDIFIDGLEVNSAHVGFHGSQGEAAYYNPYEAIPPKELRNYVLKNVKMTNITNTAFNFAGAGTFQHSYLRNYLPESEITPENQSDHLNYIIDGFDISGVGNGSGIYTSARSLIAKNGKVSGFKWGILGNNDCTSINISSIDYSNNIESINLLYNQGVWPEPRYKSGYIKNTIHIENSSHAIVLGNTDYFLIENNHFGLSGGGFAVNLLNNSRNVYVYSNHNDNPESRIAYRSVSDDFNYFYDNTGNTRRIGLWNE
ncbi:MAG TPA: hypothetical protein PKA63_13000 [Oligoflexia bacterium]|nr:hypothetical protein [Oligoflexia bacterium]HMP49577.1 hypothetical protein [Oligoflexia bacterium]